MVYTIPDKGVSIILYPDEEFSASVHVDYNSKVIGNPVRHLPSRRRLRREDRPRAGRSSSYELEPALQD